MVEIEKDTKFTKGQLIKSKRYFEQVDLLKVLLQEGQTYTLKEVDTLIEDFMNKEVN